MTGQNHRWRGISLLISLLLAAAGLEVGHRIAAGGIAGELVKRGITPRD